MSERRGWGVLAIKILDLLEQHGPMTRHEIEEHFGAKKGEMSQTINRLKRNLSREGKRIHICAWQSELVGERRYPRAVYAIGGEADKPKPKADPKAVKRRYWANRKERLKISPFVVTRRQQEERAREVRRQEV